jgi:hypothetical protein
MRTLDALGLPLATVAWLGAVALVITTRVRLLSGAGGRWRARAAAYLRIPWRVRYRNAAVGARGEGLAWLVAFGVIFSGLRYFEEPIATQLGLAAALGCIWTSGDHARNQRELARIATEGDDAGTSGTTDRAAVMMYWSSLLAMWIAFMAVACFAGRAAESLL